MPLKRGEKVVIISVFPHWYKARKDNGSEGMIPSNYMVAVLPANDKSKAESGKLFQLDKEKEAVLLKSMP